MTIADIGQNTELDENEDGHTVLRNTETGTEIRLGTFVDIVGGLGDEDEPISGLSALAKLLVKEETTLEGDVKLPNGMTVYGEYAAKEVEREDDDDVDLQLEHLPTGETWEFTADGELVTKSIDAESLDVDTINTEDLTEATTGHALTVADTPPNLRTEEIDAGTLFQLLNSDATLATDTPEETVDVEILGSVEGSGVDGDAVAIGIGSVASGFSSTALGRGSEADGIGATALGRDSEADGSGATALGRDSGADGTGATALGQRSVASGVSATALGRDSEALNNGEGVLGTVDDTNDWIVPGDFTVQGSKDFEIDHPSKPETHDLRHGAYEGPVPGGLIYNATVDAEDKRVSLEGHLPDYITSDDFGSNWTCHVTASDHFGRGYVNADEWVLVVDEPGEYDVTVFGERDDDAATCRGKHRTEKPKGERWNGEPRTYWRDCPHADPDDYDDVLRIEAKFDHTPECDPEPCEEAHVMCRVTFTDGDRVDVPDAGFEEDADSIVEKASELRDYEDE